MICRSLRLCPMTYNLQITVSQLFHSPECKQEYDLLFAITDVYYLVLFLIMIVFWQQFISTTLFSKICPPAFLLLAQLPGDISGHLPGNRLDSTLLCFGRCMCPWKLKMLQKVLLPGIQLWWFQAEFVMHPHVLLVHVLFLPCFRWLWCLCQGRLTQSKDTIKTIKLYFFKEIVYTVLFMPCGFYFSPWSLWPQWKISRSRTIAGGCRGGA